MSTQLDTASVEMTLEELKTEAKNLGISHHPSIGIVALKEKIAAKKDSLIAPVESITEATVKPSIASSPQVEPIPSIEQTVRDEALLLVRIQIACLNTAKASWKGEIFSIGNSVLGQINKYVPYNVTTHVPYIMYNHIKNKQFQLFSESVDNKGRKIQKVTLSNEFVVNMLPDLTPEELATLAINQARYASVDEE